MTNNKRMGFIGLGVMGEPICANIHKADLGSMVVLDLNADPVNRMVDLGATAATSIADITQKSELIFLSLPGGPDVEKIVSGPGGILENAEEGVIIVDLSTCPVDTTRHLFEKACRQGVTFMDAPVARTRQAAIDGSLSIMVGASEKDFSLIRPYLDPAAADITRCGEIGTGQVVKLMNNMILFQTVVALSEAMVTAERAGVSRHLLLDTLSHGSADSFALRNHGKKAMAEDTFPLNAFATDYAIKDISYALALADATGVEAPAARLAREILRKSSGAGNGLHYFPSLITLVDGSAPAK